ncbi:MAG: aldo/keto reductase [Alphaproteobacteria bacterium]|nr:aldo/keto reductase [Alphaproteobacteria bacterium]
MEQRTLGPLGPVSRLTLGGGGLGHLWGATTRQECVATVKAAVDGGITLIDLAPRYGDGEAEVVLGEAFGGRLPAGVRVTSKCLLGNTPAAEVDSRLRTSIADSLARMKLERLDLFFLHSNVAPDNHPMRVHPDAGTRMTAHSVFVEHVRPAFEQLVAEGLIGAWGITGIGHPDAIETLLNDSPRTAAVQLLANPLDSAGELKFYDGPTRPRTLMRAARTHGVGVMGIRAVQGGALAAEIDRKLPEDHAVVRDWHRGAGWRAVAAELGEDPADLAHRYALSLPDVDTVVLGIKNRQELSAALAAAERGPLPADAVARIDAVTGPSDADH